MKRPPDRKVMLALTALVVAASMMMLSRPAVGTDPGSSTAVIVKYFGRS
jgi:hypothetical protein